MRRVGLLIAGLVAIASGLIGAGVAAAAPAGFSPSSTSWPTAKHGWVLGWVPCGESKCARVYQTTDGGTTWASKAAPPIKPSEFGNQTRLVVGYRDDNPAAPKGFTAIVTNGTTVYASYNGAASWRQETFAPGEQVVGAVATSTKDAYVIHTSGAGAARKTQVLRAPLGTRTWVAAKGPAFKVGGSYPSGDIATNGASAIVSLGSQDHPFRVWTTRTGSTWVSGDNACFAGALTQVAAPSSSKLFALCSWGPGRGHMQKELKFSDTAEGFWTAGFPSDNGITSDFAAASEGVAAVGSTGGDAGFVQMTFDGGFSWQQTLEAFETGPVFDLQFADAKHGALVAGYADIGTSKAFRTVDGGKTWKTFTP